ncbi:MAG: metallophosphoesterase [Promethearchaeota archaeon]
MKRRVYFISDTHFGHANILKFEPVNRPFKTIEDHDRAIIRQWNHYIKDTDIVYHMGDIGMKCRSEYMKKIFDQLNGIKILIRGNHDKYTDSAIHWLGFTTIVQEAKIRLNKHRIVKVSHYPYLETEKGLDYVPAYPELRPTDEGIWLLHGHSHGNSPMIVPEKKMINLCWDHWKRPVSAEELISIIDKEENK